MIATDVQTASPAVKRQARYEWELDHIILDAAWGARNTQDLRQQLDKKVFSDPRYDRIPKYRQIALEAYTRGVLDAMARFAKLPESAVPHVERPKARPSDRPKRGSKTVPPSLHPTPRAGTADLPGWTMPPPPPFPPAADLGGAHP
jgi:hypothetical protein